MFTAMAAKASRCSRFFKSFAIDSQFEVDKEPPMSLRVYLTS